MKDAIGPVAGVSGVAVFIVGLLLNLHWVLALAISAVVVTIVDAQTQRRTFEEMKRSSLERRVEELEKELERKRERTPTKGDDADGKLGR